MVGYITTAVLGDSQLAYGLRAVVERKQKGSSKKEADDDPTPILS